MKTNIGIFFGGKSVEHEVSVITAMQAVAALNNTKYEAVPIYITKDDKLYYGKDLLEVKNYKDIKQLLNNCEQVTLANNGTVVKVFPIRKKLFSSKPIAQIDVALPCVHGANVEDGTLQGYLTMLGLPFAGCDVYSSAICANKRAAQAVLRTAGLPVMDSRSVRFTDYAKAADAVANTIADELSYPLIIKPINLGSSVGISRADDMVGLKNALELVFQFTDEAMVEKCVTNLREVNCSVLGDYNSSAASVLEEPVGSGTILSYQDKYQNNGTKTAGKGGMASQKRIIPASVEDSLADEIKQTALAAFAALGCSGVVRIDFLIEMDENRYYINEVNTIPGSLSFYLWEPEGKKYTQLLDELISLALKKKRESNKLNHSFESNILSNIAEGGKFGGSKQ